MKIDHLIHDDGAGGGPKTVLNHVTYYSKIHDVRLLHGGAGMLHDKLQKMGVSQKIVPFDRLWKIPAGFFAILFLLMSRKPDLLLLHGQWAGFVGSVAGKLAGVPCIVYVSQWPSFYTDWDLLRTVRNFILEATPCRICDAIVAISPGNRVEYLRRFPFIDKKLHHIPNSIDLNVLPLPGRSREFRRELGWDDAATHVVCVGRLSTQKRCDWLLRAWKIVESHQQDARLWMIGDGELGADLRSLARDLGLRHCTFLGSQKDAIRYIAASDIVAMPSMYEGHANIPLEAMACGRPIVACAVDGVRESFSDGEQGILVPPANPEAFAAGLLRLLSSPSERERMGTAGLKHVRVFEKSSILKQFLALFAKLEPKQNVFGSTG